MNISKDLIPSILSYTDWFTLQKCKKLNNFFYRLTNNEIEKRLNSDFPFGDDARISVVCHDIFIENIFITLDDNKILISKNQYSKNFIRNILVTWFLYCFPKKEFYISHKLYKSVIKLINKKVNKYINEDIQTFVFRFANNESFLEDII